MEDLENIELNALPVYNDRYMKTKIRTYGDKVYTNFCGLNVPDDGVKCKFFIVISNDSLLAFDNKHWYLDNCTYKIVDNQMIDDLDDVIFETDKD